MTFLEGWENETARWPRFFVSLPAVVFVSCAAHDVAMQAEESIAHLGDPRL
jgi:hypothetical protein